MIAHIDQDVREMIDNVSHAVERIDGGNEIVGYDRNVIKGFVETLKSYIPNSEQRTVKNPYHETTRGFIKNFSELANSKVTRARVRGIL